MTLLIIYNCCKVFFWFA